MARIFLVEDNESIREAVAGYLRLEEHEVIEFGGVADVLEVMRHKAPDLAILDVMLPDGSGFALAKKIRTQSRVPLVFLTAREAESDRITGFELGADDYVVKPFSPKELVLRVQALLRRTGTPAAQQGAGGCWEFGTSKLCFDTAGRGVEDPGAPRAERRHRGEPRAAPGREPRLRLRGLGAHHRHAREEPPGKARRPGLGRDRARVRVPVRGNQGGCRWLTTEAPSGPPRGADEVQRAVPRSSRARWARSLPRS
jgi:CheY-like chemotaxis protein